MPTDKDLFDEEQTMSTMSFGEHIEDLRKHLILALLGLAVGVAVAFIPGLNLGRMVMLQMQKPAQEALDKFYADEAQKRAKAAEAAHEMSDLIVVEVSAASLADALRDLFPDLEAPPADQIERKMIPVRMQFQKADEIRRVASNVQSRSALVMLAPMESFMIFFMVCIVTGLVLSSPWVFYQIYAFIAAGLYRHERAYVRKFLPFSLGLFLGGVFLCFFAVLPVTLDFLLQFNVWLGIEPTLRISEWISFATILPLIFGVCFQTPLVMLIIERLGIVSADDMRQKRKYAILVMIVAAAIITPTQDPFSLMLLAVPMILLYELGLVLITSRHKREAAAAAAR